MESLTLQVDGLTTGRAYIRGGAYNGNIFFCLQTGGPLTRGALEAEVGGGAYNRDFRVLDLVSVRA